MLLLPLVVFFLFLLCRFFFLFAGAHRNGCLQKEGPEAQVQSGPELEGVRLRRRVHINYPKTGCDSDFVSWRSMICRLQSQVAQSQSGSKYALQVCTRIELVKLASSPSSSREAHQKMVGTTWRYGEVGCVNQHKAEFKKKTEAGNKTCLRKWN